MLNVHDCARGSGKTTRCMNMLDNDDDAALIVQSQAMLRHYPKKYHHRAIILNNERFIGEVERQRHNSKRFVFDEGLLNDPVKMAYLYYQFGQMNLDITVFGTSYRNEG